MVCNHAKDRGTGAGTRNPRRSEGAHDGPRTEEAYLFSIAGIGWRHDFHLSYHSLVGRGEPRTSANLTRWLAPSGLFCLNPGPAQAAI